MIARIVSCRKVGHQVVTLTIVSSRKIQHTEGRKTLWVLGVIHSDKPRGQTTTNPIVKDPTYHRQSLEESKSPPPMILRRWVTLASI